MKGLMRLISPLLLVLLFASCMQQPEMADLREAVDEFNSAWAAAMTSGETAGMMKFYSDSALSLPPNMAPIKGKEAIKAWTDQMAKSEMKATVARFTMTDLSASGTVAYEIGTYEVVAHAPKIGEIKDSGSYVSIWTKQPDGSWKIHAEIWNSSLPVAGVDMKK